MKSIGEGLFTKGPVSSWCRERQSLAATGQWSSKTGRGGDRASSRQKEVDRACLEATFPFYRGRYPSPVTLLCKRQDDSLPSSHPHPSLALHSSTQSLRDKGPFSIEDLWGWKEGLEVIVTIRKPHPRVHRSTGAHCPDPSSVRDTLH